MATIILPTNQARGNLGPAASSAATMGPSAYAADLALWKNSYKHKFLFIVEIVLHPDYVSAADTSRFALLAQTATRPNIKFEHTEYNSYGIRKAVLTKTTFEPITVSFIDDNENSIMQFFTNVIKLMSPITNIDNSALVDSSQYNFKTNFGTLTKITTTSQGLNVNESMIGNHRPNVYAQTAGSPGQRLTQSNANSPVSIFDSVKIHHVHLFGEAVNTFTFNNPRLLSLDYDDLDMASTTDIAMLKMQFGYDYLTTSTSKMSPEVSRLVGTDPQHIRRDQQ